MLFVCYPNCSTCKKARAWLESQGIPFAERNIKTENPTKEELARWQKASGLPLKRFFNTSGQQYRALGLKEKLPAMTEEEQLELLSSDGMLVKRPPAGGRKRRAGGLPPPGVGEGGRRHSPSGAEVKVFGRMPARGSVAGRGRENPYPLTSFAHRGFRVGFPNLGGIPLLSPAGDL